MSSYFQVVSWVHASMSSYFQEVSWVHASMSLKSSCSDFFSWFSLDKCNWVYDCIYFEPMWKKHGVPGKGSQQRCFIKKLFVKISQYSQENIFVRVSFLIRFQVFGPATLLKTEFSTSVFLWILWNFTNTCFEEHLRTPASAKHGVQGLRSSPQRCSVRKRVLKNFAKFTGKHQWQSLFFNKVAGLLLKC